MTNKINKKNSIKGRKPRKLAMAPTITIGLLGALKGVSAQEAELQPTLPTEPIKIEQVKHEYETVSPDSTIHFDDAVNIANDTVVSKSIDETNSAPDPNKFTFSSGVKVGVDGKVESANRISGFGSIGKGSKYSTDVFGFLDIDGNPLKASAYGELYLTKKIYKNFSAEAEYVYSGSGENLTKFGLSYGGASKKGFHKITIYPITNEGKAFDIILSSSNQIGKNGELNSFIEILGLEKSFYGETEFLYNFGAHLALFVQTRYGGTLKDPFIAGVGGIRLNIK